MQATAVSRITSLRRSPHNWREDKRRDALRSHLRALRRDRSVDFTPGLVVVDETGGDIGVAMTVRQVARRDGVVFGGNRPKAKRGDALFSTAMAFITSAGDRIAALRITPSDTVVLTMNIAAAQAEGPTPEQLHEPLPATVKLAITVTPDLHQMLQQYAALYAEAYGREEAVTDLVPAMLAAFLESDRGFARGRTGGK